MTKARGRCGTLSVLGALLALSGCGGSNATPPVGRDAGGAADLALAQADDAGVDAAANADLSSMPDAATAGPDLATPPDLAMPTIAIADASVAEGNAGSTSLTFTVTLSAASADTVAVDYATADGTATVGDGDYDAATGTLTFTPGTTTRTIDVPIHGDVTNEFDETFTVTLSNPSHATLAQASAIGTIKNDDPALPSASVADVGYFEGNQSSTSLIFTVTLSGTSAQTVTVDYATADGTATLADNDYVQASGTLTFPPGQASKTVLVPMVGDITVEPDEAFTLTLSNASNATIGRATATGTIRNDDVPGPGISIGDATVLEGDSGTTTLTFPVTLSATYTSAVQVDYATQSDTASSTSDVGGIDFVAASGTLTFAPGITTQDVTVVVNGDTAREADETMSVKLLNAVNGNIVRAQATGTITNDDPVPAVSIADASGAEGDSGQHSMSFTVTLSAVSSSSVVVQFETVSGTAKGGFGAVGDDFVNRSGSVAFSAGQASQTITVSVVGDLVAEPDETFTVHLTSPFNATIARDTATGTIVNDDN